ncbi:MULTISPECIES: hypothetical protein [Pedobacter]|uniref:hypothetical protein n=1 Tax=Pedobacter TaxID=84567 RepID=UPI001E48E774|nr:MULTISPECIES: hypothetical protein [Pedobacter]
MFKLPFLIIAFGIFSITTLKAQTSPNISIGAEFGLPSGNFVSLSGIGLGASVKAEFPVSPQLALTANAGIMNFFGKRNQLINVRDLTYVPLKGGIKYQSQGFYAEAQLGAGFSTNGQREVFIWSPGIGNQFKLSGANKLDVGIRYEAWAGKNESSVSGIRNSNSKGFAGIRFAYVFGL